MIMGLGEKWGDEEDVTGSSNKTVLHGVHTMEDFSQTTDLNPIEAIPLSSCHQNSEKNNVKEKGVCGLRNLGNTCFMSAGVQCLVATPPLAHALLGPQENRHPLTKDLADLTKLMWSGQYSALQPTKFKDSLSKHYPQFNDYRQHDCQEFLALLLDGLHEQMNTASKKDFSSQIDMNDKVCDNIKAVNKKDWKREPSEPYSPKRVKNVPGWELNTRSISLDPSCYQPGTSSSADAGDNYSNLLTCTLKNDNNYPVLNNASPKCYQSIDYSVNSCLDNNFTHCKSVNRITYSSFHKTNKDIDYDAPVLFNFDKGKEINEISGAKIDSTVKILNNNMVGNCSHLSAELALNNDSLVRNPVGSSQISSLDDILKNSKTSNVNVLGAEVPQAANNSIRFDSEKYPRIDNIKKKDSFSYNALGGVGKRLPDEENPGKDLDLKRIRLEDEDEKNIRLDPPSPSLLVEKNIRMECEMKEKEQDSEHHWQHHLASNRSVVVTTFQGQFKSQVVCSVCHYVSITYEPFMYLSVPLPNAMKKVIKITYINKLLKPTEVSLEMNKNDSILLLKEKLQNVMKIKSDGPVIICEVLNHHIAKFLDDVVTIRIVNDSNRKMYAFEIITFAKEEREDSVTCDSDNVMEVEEDIPVEMNCNICLEEKDVNMKKHFGCSFLICDNCILTSLAHYGGESFKCPICYCKLSPAVDLLPVKPPLTPEIRLVKVYVVFRVNNSDFTLFGHPAVIRLPNRCQSEWLHSSLSSINPFDLSFSILIVDGQGLWCGRCMFSAHCRGCVVSENFKLLPGDTLAMCFSTMPKLIPAPSQTAPSLNSHSSLTIYDCINAFSQSEHLDENNPWFCPSCKKNQCATKTLSIWRFPDYLIVYLKRFVFHNQISIKLDERVEFPVKGLNLSGLLYDLYACVCHVGGISAGHYTTYTLHSETGIWHYFNDSYVSKQSPKEQDFNSAYILFYKKQSL